MRVGIDLGTTYSAVARYDQANSRPVVINNTFGKELTPSVICFLDNGDVLVGEDAKDMQAGGTGAAAAAFKRAMGDQSFTVEAAGAQYSAEDLSAILLKKLISDAEAVSGEKIDSAVITVPAYFNDFQRKATIRAGEACGVKVLKIVNEPTAAAISYGYSGSSEKTILVYDLGGGTFDVTILEARKGGIEVKGTDGNHLLGGKDWDAAVSKFVAEQFLDEFGVDPRDDESAKNELIVASENYKKVLSRSDSVTIQLKHDGNAGKYTLTREAFDAMTEPLLLATREVCAGLISSLGMSWGDIDEVLLVGGSTRMPQVEAFLRELIGARIVSNSDTDLAVVKGAAITAALYAGDSKKVRAFEIKDVTAHSLGALSLRRDGKAYVNEVMIPKNSKIPASVRKPFRLGEGNMTDVVEVYILQGESADPRDCHVLSKVSATGFENDGGGTEIEIEYRYNENGVVDVAAYQGGEPLIIESEPVPEDTGWMGEAPRPAERAVEKSVVICVDMSRSMDKIVDGVRPLDEVKRETAGFVRELAAEGAVFGLVGFGDKVGVIRDMTSDQGSIIGALESLKVNEYGRGTDASPIGTAAAMLSSRSGVRMILILTDGKWGKRDAAVAEARACRSSDIVVIAMGFGNADVSFLKQIATVDEGAIFTTIRGMGEKFSTIATAVKKGSMGLREGGSSDGGKKERIKTR
ncbi:MAG: Hsp70 family protein [Candidatus Methanoplasma sp.]|jgi:molecular chaperone DnaK|nr:Hsp70 family protein [Candidatus Methanoplasma sp.]